MGSQGPSLFLLISYWNQDNSLNFPKLNFLTPSQQCEGHKKIKKEKKKLSFLLKYYSRWTSTLKS